MSNLGKLSELDLSKVECLDKRQKSIAELVSGKTVLSIGCVDMFDVKDYESFLESGLHQMFNLKQTAKNVTGIDINRRGIEKLKSEGFDAHYLDVFNIPDDCDLVNNKYDVIVVSHVIEHIPNMYEFLRIIRYRFNFNKLIIAVPNAYHYYSVLNVFFRKKEVISNDHYYTFSPITLVKLLTYFELKVDGIWFDKEHDEIKLGKKYKLLGLIHSWAKKVIFKNNGDIIVCLEKENA